MTLEFNHTIIEAADRDATARHLTEILGLPEAREWGPFRIIEAANAVHLAVLAVPEPARGWAQHYGFLVSEGEFDAILDRLEARGVLYWADPFHQIPGRNNTNDGGRGLYWEGPDGQNLEIITVRYGRYPESWD